MRLRDLVRDRAVWIYAALTAAVFWQPLTTKTFFFRDFYKLVYPKRLLLASAVRSGTFPLWDPFTNGGQPYLATPATAALHPANILYVILPLDVAFNFVPVLHVFFCAVAAYWLARVVGLSAVAAFVSGVAYAFAGVTLSGMNVNVAWILSFPCFPLAVGLMHRALRDRRSLIPPAIAAAMPLFAGMAELTAFLFLTLLVWAISVRFEVSRTWRAAVVAVTIVGAIGLSLAATLPATSVIEQSPRGIEKRSYESFTGWSVHPRRLPELIVPRFFGPLHTLGSEYWGAKWETDGFPYILSIYFGAPLLILAAFGARGRLEHVDAPRLALGALVVAAVLLSLGKYLPGFRLIYDHVPLVTILRYPSKVLALAALPVALLAGCGIERVTAKAAAAIGAAVLAVIAVLAAAMSPDRYLIASLLHAAIATGAFIGALFMKRRAIAVAAVVTADLLVAGYTVNAYAPRALFDEPRLAGIVRQIVGPMRFHSPRKRMVVKAPTNELFWLVRTQLATLDDYNALVFGIPVVFHTDYDGLAPYRIVQLGREVARGPWNRKKAIFDAAGVRAFVSEEEVQLPGVRKVLTMPYAGGNLHLYENLDALPGRFVGPCGGGRVALLRRELNAARYEVDAPCEGRVILAETHYDGWTATIDGRAAPEHRAGHAFTALNVQKGRHMIERRYFPPRLGAGVAGSAIALLALLLINYLTTSPSRPLPERA